MADSLVDKAASHYIHGETGLSSAILITGGMLDEKYQMMQPAICHIAIDYAT